MWAFSSRQWESLEVNKEGRDVIGSVLSKDQYMGYREWIRGAVDSTP